MSTVHRIALLGFSAFERNTLGSYFRLASTREPHYEQVQMLPEADFVVADADHEPAVKLVLAVERLPETVFVGARAPEGAIAWLTRPIDPMRVLRQLDVMAARRMSQPGAAVRAESPADAARRRTVIQPVRPPRPDAPAELLAPPAETLDLTLPDLPDATGRCEPAERPTAASQPATARPPARTPVLPAGPAPTLRVPSREAAPSAPARSAAPAACAAPAAPMEPVVSAAPVAAVAAVAAVATVPAVWSVRAVRSTPSAAASVATAAPVVAAAAAAAATPPPTLAAQVAPIAPVPALAARAAASMPAAAAKPATPRPPAPANWPGHAAAHATPSAALLVDDSDLALRFLQMKLAPFGLQTDCVSHSEAAIKLLAERRYDFVFLDMELGERSALDGLSLCQRIKESPAASNVVMVTAHHTELDRVRGALAGCDGFLGKPLDEEELALYLARFGVRPAANAGRMPS